MLTEKNVTAGDIDRLKNMENVLCVGTVCLNATAKTLCFGGECMNATDVQGVKRLSGQVSTSQICVGGNCMGAGDITTLKGLPSVINSTNMCIGSNCVASSDFTNLKALPTRVNATNVCIGVNCLVSSDITTLKNVSTQVNTTRLCMGSNCIDTIDLNTLNTLPTQLNASNICIGSTCLVSSDLTYLKKLPNQAHFPTLLLFSNYTDVGVGARVTMVEPGSQTTYNSSFHGGFPGNIIDPTGTTWNYGRLVIRGNINNGGQAAALQVWYHYYVSGGSALTAAFNVSDGATNRGYYTWMSPWFALGLNADVPGIAVKVVWSNGNNQVRIGPTYLQVKP